MPLACRETFQRRSFGVTAPPRAAKVVDSDANSKLRFTFDYSLDSNGFFSNANQSRRKVLELAGQILLAQFTDDLAAITPSGTNTWRPNIRHPSKGSSTTQPLHNLPASLRVAANEIIVYVGSQDFSGGVRAIGGPGGVSAFNGSESFLNTVRSRGESGALGNKPTDFAPSIGSISFDSASSTNWYFGLDSQGIGANQIDFLSVAVHELVHVLGFGTAPSWNTKISNGGFSGANAQAADNGSGNVSVHESHWSESVRSKGGFVPLMSGEIATGVRRPITELDFAALDDIGWQVAKTSVDVSAAHRFADNGKFPVEILLRGNSNGTVVAERSFSLGDTSVTNVKPDVAVVSTQSAQVGKLLSIANIGQIVDPGFQNSQGNPETDETFSYTIDWGDGSKVDQGTATIDRPGSRDGKFTMASFNGSHTYTTVGDKTVNVRVVDDDGGVGAASFLVSVSPAPALKLSLNHASVNEDAGDAAAQLTITRTDDNLEVARTVATPIK